MARHHITFLFPFYNSNYHITAVPSTQQTCTEQYSTVQYSTVQYSAVQPSIPHVPTECTKYSHVPPGAENTKNVQFVLL